ncbi:MAG: PAS domain S-box protein [Candidatus Melainabacteria bacterium]|nr:PAS domain S-box protein [Candidatus Melainabacteria bacterium]
MLNNNLKTTQILSQLGSQVLLLDYNSKSNRKDKLTELINDFSKEHTEIVYVAFTDNAGNILCKSKFADLYEITKNGAQKISPPMHVPFIKVSYTKSGKILTIAEPIQYNSNFLGWVWAGIPDAGFTIVGSKKELLVFLFEIFLLVWILSVIGAIVNSLIITRPLRKLEKGAKAITEGRFGFQLPLKGFLGKELSQLVKAFNKMSKRLQQYEESNIATLSSERNKFESVVMSIADGVIVLDREGIIQIVNPAAKRLLNRSGDELIGHNFIKVWNVRPSDQIFGYLNSIKSEAVTHISEYANFEFERENKNLRLIITPLYDSNNDKLGAVLVIQDRTKEAEIESIKQEFISNVSHELRTPITSIKCYVDTLCSHSEKIDEPTKVEFLSIVNEETDRLSNLVNDVLELSRLESLSTKLHLTLQEIYPAIEYALKSIFVLAEKKSIKLIKDIAEELPMLNINQENLERILINLLSNAIKYTPGNGMIKLSVHKESNSMVFKVIDNGIGIEEEHLPLIFERFYRVENKVHTIKGTGLGLTIVKKSVEQHDGKISVRSRLGEGSIFEFILPIPSEAPNPVKIKDFEKEAKVAKSA